jgi:response regulator RpfG family c-di-GMP phosphodiesterase
MGLRDTTKILMDRHVIGDEEFTASEKIIYMRHPEMTAQALHAKKIIVSPRVLDIISDHHENWDGSGFKAISGPTINYSARILRLADDIVACISHPKNHLGFREALAHVSARGTQFKAPWYDPQVVNKLGESLGIGEPIQYG